MASCPMLALLRRASGYMSKYRVECLRCPQIRRQTNVLTNVSRTRDLLVCAAVIEHQKDRLADCLLGSLVDMVVDDRRRLERLSQHV
jgi:hypothetical protein